MDAEKIIHELTMEYLRRSPELKANVSVKEFVKFYLQTKVEIQDEIFEYAAQPAQNPEA